MYKTKRTVYASAQTGGAGGAGALPAVIAASCTGRTEKVVGKYAASRSAVMHSADGAMAKGIAVCWGYATA